MKYTLLITTFIISIAEATSQETDQIDFDTVELLPPIDIEIGSFQTGNTDNQEIITHEKNNNQNQNHYTAKVDDMNNSDSSNEKESQKSLNFKINNDKTTRITFTSDNIDENNQEDEEFNKIKIFETMYEILDNAVLKEISEEVEAEEGNFGIMEGMMEEQNLQDGLSDALSREEKVLETYRKEMEAGIRESTKEIQEQENDQAEMIANKIKSRRNGTTINDSNGPLPVEPQESSIDEIYSAISEENLELDQAMAGNFPENQAFEDLMKSKTASFNGVENLIEKFREHNLDLLADSADPKKERTDSEMEEGGNLQAQDITEEEPSENFIETMNLVLNKAIDMTEITSMSEPSIEALFTTKGNDSDLTDDASSLNTEINVQDSLQDLTNILNEKEANEFSSSITKEYDDLIFNLLEEYDEEGGEINVDSELKSDSESELGSLPRAFTTSTEDLIISNLVDPSNLDLAVDFQSSKLFDKMANYFNENFGLFGNDDASYDGISDDELTELPAVISEGQFVTSRAKHNTAESGPIPNPPQAKFPRHFINEINDFNNEIENEVEQDIDNLIAAELEAEHELKSDIDNLMASEWDRDIMEKSNFVARNFARIESGHGFSNEKMNGDDDDDADGKNKNDDNNDVNTFDILKKVITEHDENETKTFNFNDDNNNLNNHDNLNKKNLNKVENVINNVELLRQNLFNKLKTMRASVKSVDDIFIETQEAILDADNWLADFELDRISEFEQDLVDRATKDALDGDSYSVFKFGFGSDNFM